MPEEHAGIREGLAVKENVSIGRNSGGVTLTNHGMRFPDNYSFEMWLKDGNALGSFSKSLMFCIGDWCNFGEKAYGEKYAQALDNTKFSYGTLRNAAWVCRVIPLERRRPWMSFGHANEVAKLKDKEKIEEVLNTVEVERLSTHQTRMLVSKLNKNPALDFISADQIKRPRWIGFDTWWMMKKDSGWNPRSEKEACQEAYRDAMMMYANFYGHHVEMEKLEEKSRKMMEEDEENEYIDSIARKVVPSHVSEPLSESKSEGEPNESILV